MSCERYSKDSENLRKVLLFCTFFKVKNGCLVFSPPDRETRKPRGFTFVKFCNPEDAESAIKAMDGTVKLFVTIPFLILLLTGLQGCQTES